MRFGGPANALNDRLGQGSTHGVSATLQAHVGLRRRSVIRAYIPGAGRHVLTIGVFRDNHPNCEYDPIALCAGLSFQLEGV